MSLLNWLFKTKFTKSGSGVISGADKDQIRLQWRKIEELISLGKPSQLRQAVIEADKLLELALKKLVNENQSLGDNLKQAKDVFPTWEEYQKAWAAHKIRNALVHEAGYELPHYLAKDALESFRRVLVSLRVL